MLSDAQQIQSTLSRLASEGAPAGRIADKAVSIWRDVDAALSPVIGQRGVAALFKRSLSLTRPAHAWLAAVQEGADRPGDFAALKTALSQQTSSDAVAANGELLQKFLDLLTHLIGESLTARLLRSVWDNSSSDGTVQDISP